MFCDMLARVVPFGRAEKRKEINLNGNLFCGETKSVRKWEREEIYIGIERSYGEILEIYEVRRNIQLLKHYYSIYCH
jgi:hypothetical protein